MCGSHREYHHERQSIFTDLSNTKSNESIKY